MQLSLKSNQDQYRNALDKIKTERVVERIWARDHTVWHPEPTEIANRLGWLDVAERYAAEVGELNTFAEELHAEGYSHVLLLGMGGSSLAPEVLRKVIGVGSKGLDLAILDSTDPGAVKHWAARLDLRRTLFVVATKSGGTVETFSFFKYFYNLVCDQLGEESAGEHFIAITDPGSGLVDTANRYDFRKVFLNDPQIGGRYSALSMFGLVPAALLGLDLSRFLSHAIRAASAAHDPEGIAARLGAAMGALALAGKDKLTLLMSPEIESFGDWVEQLVAESTGKMGKGILPVVGERAGSPEDYGQDRLFVGLTIGDDESLWDQLETLSDAGYPVIWFNLEDAYQLGAQFFIWELATAIAGHVMGIQPFDQPDVESAKVQARKMVAAYQESGELPEGDVIPLDNAHLRDFLGELSAGDYIGVHAYITPTAESDRALKALQYALRQRTGLAVTVGYGPRFLHSTGQLHKGDAGRGCFIQLISSAEEDLGIPDEAGGAGSQMSFQVLKRAQALGDAAALREASPPRRVVQYRVDARPAAAIESLVKFLK